VDARSDPESEMETPADATEAPAETTRLLATARDYIQGLPSQERHIAHLAAAGAPVWQIAQEMRMSEAAVARTIDGVIAAVTGREVEMVETGGLGADTDAGVSGGYDPGDLGQFDPDDEAAPRDSEEA